MPEETIPGAGASSGPAARIGVVWRGDPDQPDPEARAASRLGPLFEALGELGVAIEAVLYSEERAEAVRDHLLGLDGVLVWVNPIQDGRDRAGLDALLTEVSAAGVWVATHPDVILAMGTKEVLYQTRNLSWSADTHLYRSRSEMDAQLPGRLVSGARVLKQYRGNGGNGVWKVEAVSPGPVWAASAVRSTKPRSGRRHPRSWRCRSFSIAAIGTSPAPGGSSTRLTRTASPTA